MHVLITGASGYIGKHLTEYLLEKNYSKITVLTRDANIEFKNTNVNIILYNNFNELNLDTKLKNIDCIIHLISKQHEISKFNKAQYEDYYFTNVKILNKLIEFAKKINVKKFIFTSTIKVYGEYTLENSKFNLSSNFNPISNYAKTKLLAEKQLIINLKNSSTKYTILRLPLVYGSEVKGNFKLLYNLVNTNFPLPLNKINNFKSLLHVNNLLEFIEKVINSDLSNNQEFNICDDDDISTTEIIKIIQNKHYKNNYLFYFPHIAITKFLTFFYKENFLIKLFHSLQVDNQYAKKIMKWKPKYNFYDL